MNNTNTSQANIQIKLLISKLIDLDELELRIEEALQSISEIDPLLVSEVKMKLSQGRDIQYRAKDLLLKNSDTLNEDDVENARKILKESQNLKINYPEVKNLELICKLLDWLKKVQSALETCVSPNVDGKPKQDGSISSQFDKIERFLDGIREPEQIHGKTRWLLKPLINEFRNVEFGDERLNNMIRILSQIVWIKDASDLLLRDNIMLSELRVLYETRVTGGESKFPQKEMELIALYDGQNEWTRGIKEFEETVELDKIDELLKGHGFEGLLRDLISTLLEFKAKYTNFIKINDLRDFKGKVELYIGWIEWAIEGEKLLRNTEHIPCKFRELENLCSSAKLKDLPNTWEIRKALETKYEQAVVLINLCEQKLHDPTIKAIKPESEKLPVAKGEEILREARALNEFVIVEKEIELITQRLKEVDAWKEKMTSFVMNYKNHLQANSLYDEYLRHTLEEELYMIKSELSELSFILEAESKEFLNLETCFRAWVLTKGREKKKIEEWVKLRDALQRNDNTTDETQFLLKINEQITLYDKSTKALEDLIKQDEKIFGGDKRRRLKISLITLDDAQRLRETIDTCQIEFADRRIFLDDVIHRGERLCDQYYILLREKKIIGEYESLAENVRKLPLKLFFEQSLDDIIYKAEKIGDKLKRHNLLHKENVSDIIKEYQAQEVLFPELERMSKIWDQSEQKIKEISKKVQEISKMTREELLKFSDEISEIPEEYTDERVKNAKLEVFIRAAEDFRASWESEFPTECTINFSGLRGLYNEAEHMKAQAVEDLRILNLHSFLESASRLAEGHAQSIRTMSYLQVLEEEDKKKILRNVDFTDVIVERKMQLDYARFMEVERQKELENKKKFVLKKIENSSKKNTAADKSFAIPSTSNENLTRALAVARALPINEGLEQLKIFNMQQQPQQQTKNRAKKEEVNSSKKGKRTPVADRIVPEQPAQKNEGNNVVHSSSYLPQTNIKNIDITSNQGRCIFVGALTKALEENPFIELPDILISEYSISMVDEIVRITIEGGKKSLTGQICQQIVDLFYKLRRFPSLTFKLAEEKFTFDLVNKLRDKSDSYLESKERQILMTEEGKNKKEESWGGKLKRKQPKAVKENLLTKRKAENNISTQLLKKQHVNPLFNNNNSNNNNEQEQKSKNIPAILQEFLINEESPVSAVKEGTKLNTQGIKGLKERELLLRFRLEKGTLASRKLFEDLSPMKNNGFEDINEVFSECEEDRVWKGTEPLREDEVDAFEKFLKKYQKNEHNPSKSSKPIMFDPDGDDHHNHLMNFYSSEPKPLSIKPEKGTSLKIFEGVLKNFLEDYSPLVMMITNCDFDALSHFPNNTALNMKLHRRINRSIFEEQIDSIMRQNDSNEKLVPGWFESPVLSTFDVINDIANDLNISDQVGVMKWARKCRVYVMHREMMSVSWRLKLNFRQGFVNVNSRQDSDLIFIMRHKAQPLEEIKAFISPTVAEIPNEEQPEPTVVKPKPEKPISIVESLISESAQKKKSTEKLNKKIRSNTSAHLKTKQPTLLDKFRNYSDFAKDIKEFSVKVDDLREEEKIRNLEEMRRRKQQAKRKAFLQKKNLNHMNRMQHQQNMQQGHNSELLTFVNNFKVNMQNKKQVQDIVAENIEIPEPKLIAESRAFNKKIPTPSKTFNEAPLLNKTEKTAKRNTPLNKLQAVNEEETKYNPKGSIPKSQSQRTAADPSRKFNRLQKQQQPERLMPTQNIEYEEEPEEPMLVEEDYTDYEPSVHLDYSPSKLVTEDEEIEDELENHAIERDGNLEQKIISLVQETARKPSVGKLTPGRKSFTEEPAPMNSINNLYAEISNTLKNLRQAQKMSIQREENTGTVMQTPFNKNKDYRSSYYNTNSSFKGANNFDIFNFSQHKPSTAKSTYSNTSSRPYFKQFKPKINEFEPRNNYGYNQKPITSGNQSYLEEEVFNRPHPRVNNYGNPRSFTPNNRNTEYQRRSTPFQQENSSMNISEKSFTPRTYYKNNKIFNGNNIQRRYSQTPSSMQSHVNEGYFEEYNFNDISNNNNSSLPQDSRRNNYQKFGYQNGNNGFQQQRYKNNGFYQSHSVKRNFAIQEDELIEKENSYL